MENFIRRHEIEHSVIVVHGRKMFVFLLGLLVFLSVSSRLLIESGTETVEDFFYDQVAVYHATQGKERMCPAEFYEWNFLNAKLRV